MECCVVVSIETVSQVVKFYTIVNFKKNLKKLTFRTVYSFVGVNVWVTNKEVFM